MTMTSTGLRAPSLGLSPSEREQLLLYRHFLSAVIEEIRSELESRIKVSVWTKVRRTVGGTLPDLFARFDALLTKAHDDQFMSVLGAYQQQATNIDKADRSGSDVVGVDLNVVPRPGATLSVQSSANYSTTSEREREYAEVLMRIFDIREYIDEIRILLAAVSIKHLYVFVDDFSELPRVTAISVVELGLGPFGGLPRFSSKVATVWLEGGTFNRLVYITCIIGREKATLKPNGDISCRLPMRVGLRASEAKREGARVADVDQDGVREHVTANECLDLLAFEGCLDGRAIRY